IWFNKAVWIEESILDVEWSLFFAFLLVILVIYLSLGRFSEALIPSAALPMSLVGTFIAMYLLDFSLDLLSLLALTLSVGFVVDDAIVVLENIVRHQEGGKSPYQASMDGSKQICFTVLSMTLSLVAVFIPLLFMQGMNGRLFREFSLTLAISILVSGFISLSLTPMLCRLFLPKQHSATQTKVQSVISGLNGKLVSLYNRSLRVCLNYRKTVLAVAFLVIALTIPLFSRLPVNLIPPEDRGFIMTMVNLPNGTSASETQDYQKRLEDVVKGIPGIMDILDINYEGNIFLLVRLFPQSERRPQALLIADIQNALNKIASIQAYVQGYQLINLNLEFAGGGYKFILRGRDFEEVNEVSQELVNALKKNPIFLSVDSSISTDSPQLAVNVNEEYANTLGLGKNEVQKLLQNAYGQFSVGKLQRGDQQQKIYMELLPDYRSSISALNKLFLTTSGGSQVPLKAIATWEEKLGVPKLTRRDQLASAVVRFALNADVNVGEGLKMAEEIALSTLPSSVTGALDDSARAVTSTIKNTLFLLLAAAVVMYVVLGILYESFIHPLTILSSLPFAALGGVLTLFLFNEPISIFSAVGFLLLIGIVKKNGIMMIDYALEAQERGLSSLEAIVEGCLIRFRPIMMTTIAAVMGAIPIAIGFGEGAEMRRGLGLVIVGGLLFAQALTLYVTPILYLTFDRFSRKNS
ncbi:MAG: efflux RND transporter permease subunit, partial [Parachlamydiaceae bacterium]